MVFGMEALLLLLVLCMCEFAGLFPELGVLERIDFKVGLQISSKSVQIPLLDEACRPT